MEIKDRKGKAIKVGDKVKWYDPEIEARDLKRIYVVNEICIDPDAEWLYEDDEDYDDVIIRISDDFSEAEVFGHELKVI